MEEATMVPQSAPVAVEKPRWAYVFWFLGITFGITYGLNLVLYLAGGLFNMATTLVLQLQMLLPAFSAMVVILLVYREHPMHLSQRSQPGYPRWAFVFYAAFILLTMVMAVLALLGLARPERIELLSAIGLIANLVLIMVLIALRVVGGGESFARAGLAGGTFGQWLLYGGALAAFYGLHTALNAAFNLGQAVDIQAVLGPLGVPAGVPTGGLYALMAVQTILVGSLVGLMMAFGEEFGWRGFLQTELVRLGKVRGILLLGLIWGVWHAPVILMGYNYPENPVLGVFVMTAYTVVLGFVFGYAVLKTGSVWVAAFLHAVNNQALAFFMSLVHTPDSTIFSFGLGIYGILLFVPVVLLLLRDKVWKEQ